jgi:hypothetical protein
MAELPWFKFNPSMWLSGDISCTSYETQGIFIKICSLYWKSGCSIDQAKLKRRLSITSDVLAELEDEGIIEISDDNIFIKFLDEQYEELNAAHVKRVTAGSKGGKKRVSNAKAMLKQGSSIKKKETELEEDTEAHPDFGLYKDTGRPMYDPMSDTGLRVAFLPHIEYRVAQMGDILAGLRWIIEKSDYDSTLAAAEELSGTGKIWINDFTNSFKESQA